MGSTLGILDRLADPRPSTSTTPDKSSAGAVATAQTGQALAFLWDETNGVQDLGILEGGDWSSALAINNAGVVVGEVGFGLDETRAFIWDAENGMRPLESPEGTLSKGAATSTTRAKSLVRLTLRPRRASGTTACIVNLELEVGHPAGWDFSEVRAINASGQIVGWGENPDGQAAGSS